ncbi:MAG: NAD(P)H-dependent oxidoreductase [Acidaminococcus sp.]|nr:NAD(P)H-dependent oxidoreductase [Acidaminococcus sp.]MCI2100330.1 NAD(P)H-dependent oxidoreductase [Acidaminococcus sp.]MCI2114651.1 NAD(P)H-dependent oxidoreductase [Acidaminococcus sp.]MCI2116697.1 NAD(P)H-dependent oxidoreductase [Acidaminococcus sp.]
MKSLVAYFSYSGNTKRAAEQIAKAVGADLFPIEPAAAYPASYNECLTRARDEESISRRPQMKVQLTQAQLETYDTIFIGYPIWWYNAPMIIYSFAESLDFSNKRIIPFAVSGGSGISGSDTALKKICKGAKVQKGTMLNGYSAADIRNWALAAIK